MAAMSVVHAMPHTLAMRCAIRSSVFDSPVLIYQGTRDEVVNPASVERWAEGRRGVTLRLVDDGHQLLQHMEPLWEDVARFIGEGA